MNIKSLQKKRMVLPVLITLLLNMAGMTKVFAYDLTITAPSGQTLYLDYIDHVLRRCKIVHPANSTSNPWDGYTKPTGQLILPTSVVSPTNFLTYSIVSVGEYAFYGCEEITSVSIPSQFTSIGNRAFYGCSGITGTLALPNQLTSIGSYAFYNCSGLQGPLLIPNEVTTIGDHSFYGCTGITILTIGTGVTSIGGYSFWNCPSLTTVNFNAENCTQMYTDYSGYHSVFNSGTTATGPTAITTLTLGGEVTKIPNYAFSNSPSLNQQLELPSTLTYIGKDAFYNCSSLYGTLTIPSDVTSIGDGAFNGCSGFTGTLTFSSGGSWVPSPRGTTALTSSALLTIGNSTFRDCSGLTGHVVVPNSVTTMGDHSFYGCTGITELTIGTGVTRIYGYSFWNCPMLATVHFNAASCTQMYTDYSGYHSVFNSGTTATSPTAITTLTIGSGVNRIPDYAFSNSPSLNQQLELPNALTYIGKESFYNCQSLHGTLTIPNPVTNIGDGAFNGCSGISGTLALSNQLVTIGNSAFRDCSGLTGHVVVPNSVTTMGDHSFYGCTGITELTIGTGVTRIYGYSFWNCPMLATVHFNAASCTQMYTDYSGYHSVFNSSTTPTDSPAITMLTIGSGVNRIPNYAFKNSTQIFGVVLPQYLSDIGQEAFKGCVHLASITTLSTTPPSVGNNAFNSVPLTIPVFVPCNKYETYVVANGWSQFSNIIELCSNQITAIAFPSEGGSVNGAGTYASGQNCALSAIPNSGYTFLHWTKNGEIVSTNTTYVFVVNESGNYVASFVEGPSSYTISASANPSNGGTVSGGGTYSLGATCTLVATANSGYSFTNWMENGTVVSTNASYSFTVTDNRTLVANFTATSVNYIINVSANPSNGGTVTGGGSYQQGATCTVTATANENYTFVNWTKDGNMVSTNATYSFTVIETASYVANFSSNENHWMVDIYQYPYNMSITGVIQILGEEQNTPTLEIGAFSGDECRGSQRLTYFPQVNRYLVFLTLYGDAGDEMSFRLYDHSVGEELDLSCSSTVSFVPDGFIGGAIDPYVFDFGNTMVDQVSNFSQGYNWWGTYIELNGMNGLQMLEEGLGGNGVTIRSQAGYTDYYAGYGWYGSLSSMNNESSYKVITSAPCTVTMTGNAAVPSQHPITVSYGWTWIGYVPSTAMSVDAAMAGVSATQGDKLKSQYGYSEYYLGYGWFGSLNTIEPGMGLMYYSTNGEAVTFTYPDGNRGGELKANLTAENNHWKPNTYAYPDNMTVMAVVELNDMELTSDNYELAAFAANGECRGSVRLTYAEPLHRHVAFLTIAGSEAAELSFRLYDTETNEEYYAAEESLDFVANAIVGEADDLYTIHFRGTAGMDELASSVKVYPNPVNVGERFSIGVANVETYPVHVEIVNALGVETLRATSVQTPVSMVAPVTSGVYTLRITVEGKGTVVKKLVVK